MSQSKKNNKGFTLVEVIVVAVIVAILAAVAIPIYQQYVIDSRANSAQNAGGSIASFMGACITNSGTATPLTVTAWPQQIKCEKPAGGTAISSIEAPNKINITISNAAASGTVTAKHVDSPAAASSYVYNY